MKDRIRHGILQTHCYTTMILATYVLFQYPIYHRVFTNAVHQAAYTTRLFS